MFVPHPSEITLVQGFTLASLLFVTYAVSTVIYRLYFHPLAKYPGPFWARISGWPSYYHTLKKDRHIWFLHLQQQYGPEYRFGPDDVLFNTPAGHESIFSNKANVKKSQYYDVYPRTSQHLTTWNSTDKTVHARKRRVLAHAFSEKAMRGVEPLIHENLDRWCDLLKQEIDDGSDGWSGSIEMADWCTYLVFDILGDLCFGKSFDMKEKDSKMRFAPGLMVEFLNIMHPIAYSPFTALWVWLKPRGLNSLLAATAPPAMANWYGFVESCFYQRAKIEEDLEKSPKPESEIRKDFFHFLFGAIDPVTGQPGYSRNELFGESEMLIIAGSDTTATTLAAAMFYLARNQDVQERLAAEMRANFQGISEIKGGPRLLKESPYLLAVIKETLRVAPPIPADMGREVLPGGLQVDGKFVAPGARVSTSLYCIGQSPDIYDKPEEFRPERWIVGEKGSTVESVAKAESGYFPFSAGPRNCVGKNLAYLELSVVLGRFLYEFEVKQFGDDNFGGGSPEFVEGRRNPEQYQLHDIFVAERHGPNVQVRRRV